MPETTPTDEARIIADSVTIEGWDELAQQMKVVFGEIGKLAGDDVLTQLGFTGGDVFDNVAESTLEEAAARAGDLIGKRILEDGTIIDSPSEFAITDSTRDMLFDTLNNLFEAGASPGAIKSEIVSSYGFSARRALTIARTERSFAQQRGALNAAKASGVVKGKRNVLASAHPDDLDDECTEAEDVGIIPLDEVFPDGSDGPPFHPNCSCTLEYSTEEVPDEEDTDTEANSVEDVAPEEGDEA